MLGIEDNEHVSQILLGKPFYKTSKTKVDVYSGILIIEFNVKISEFNVHANNPICSVSVGATIDKHLKKVQETIAKLEGLLEL